ncbi:hypothetical protein MASR2M66_01330 [Chloroflexota bacterium]
MLSNENKFQTFFLRYGLWACVISLWLTIGLYAYLGIYSRYMADDYCEANRVIGVSSIRASIDRYNDGAWRAANRYSNIMFVGFSEQLGENSIPITIVIMTLLWAFVVPWNVREIRKLLHIEWDISMDLFLGELLVYFSFLMAPNLYQTVYWRSSMMTHFAPLVFGLLVLGFILRQARRSWSKPVSILVHIAVLISTFILAGFSEPPTTTLISALPLLIIATWLWDNAPNKYRRIQIIATAFIGFAIGFVVMLLSPAISDVASEKSNGVVWVILTSFEYALTFLLDSFKIIPLPLFISFLLPFLLFWSLNKNPYNGALRVNSRQLLMWMIFMPFIMGLLIAASFAPSVFGQSYPVERMRFLARLLMIITLMLEGILLGLLLPDFNIKWKVGVWAPLVALIIIATAYSLRTAVNLIQVSIPEYRQRADYWDRREALIISKAAAGETDLVIPGLSGIYGVKELDDRPFFWVNKCAAQIYGVNSIRTVGVDEEELEQLLND